MLVNTPFSPAPHSIASPLRWPEGSVRASELGLGSMIPFGGLLQRKNAKTGDLLSELPFLDF